MSNSFYPLFHSRAILPSHNVPANFSRTCCSIDLHCFPTLFPLLGCQKYTTRKASSLSRCSAVCGAVTITITFITDTIFSVLQYLYPLSCHPHNLPCRLCHCHLYIINLPHISHVYLRFRAKYTYWPLNQY
jgi:hypothetical protein